MPGRASTLIVRLLVVLALVASPLAAARSDLDRSAFGPVATELLAHVHAVVVPCELVLATDTVCFVTTPATVAMLAEGIEELVGASDGRLVRSAWQSANGVHRVDLVLADQVWGALEVWLSETTDRSVAGLIRYVPQHRLKGP